MRAAAFRSRIMRWALGAAALLGGVNCCLWCFGIGCDNECKELTYFTDAADKDHMENVWKMVKQDGEEWVADPCKRVWYCKGGKEQVSGNETEKQYRQCSSFSCTFVCPKNGNLYGETTCTSCTLVLEGDPDTIDCYAKCGSSS